MDLKNWSWTRSKRQQNRVRWRNLVNMVVESEEFLYQMGDYQLVKQNNFAERG
jgi:hypothetical protein